MKCFMALMLISIVAIAEDEGPRDKLVKNAQRVEKAVLQDLGSLREKGCHLLKNKKCVEEKEAVEEKKEEKSN